MANVVITEFMDEPAVARLAAAHEAVYDAKLVDDPSRLIDQAKRADALIVRNRTQVTPALLDDAPRLIAVGRLGVGLDNIDLAACAQRGVQVFPATGANARAVAEYVIATALMLLRRAYLSSASVAAGEWPRAALSSGRELAGSTMAVIGFGAIGQLVARLARALDMRVVGYDPQQPASAACWSETGAQCVTFEHALRTADVVSVHVPLIDATRNLLDADRLSMLKPHAAVINTSRGGVIDETALAEALRQGRLGGAALDVFAEEPLAQDSPLWDMPNVLVSPHSGSTSDRENERLTELFCENLRRFLAGEPLLNVLDTERLY